MTIETASYPTQLDPSWPLDVDIVAEGAGHIRLLKQVPQNWAPLASAPMTVTMLDLNKVGITQAQTSNDTSPASTAYVQTAILNAAISATLPAQTGNGGKVLETNGVTVSWEFAIADQSGNSGKILTTNGVTDSWMVQYQYIHVREQQTSGTDGGTFTSGSFVTRTLNTTSANTITGASLATNQITLPAGTYQVDGRAPARQVGSHKCKLRNITDSSDVLIGSSETCASAAGVQTDSILKGVFTIASPKVFELQHRAQTTANTTGLGSAASFSVDEVYSEVFITKLL